MEEGRGFICIAILLWKAAIAQGMRLACRGVAPKILFHRGRYTCHDGSSQLRLMTTREYATKIYDTERQIMDGGPATMDDIVEMPSAHSVLAHAPTTATKQETKSEGFTYTL